jgi:hypothetical protein
MSTQNSNPGDNKCSEVNEEKLRAIAAQWNLRDIFSAELQEASLIAMSDQFGSLSSKLSYIHHVWSAFSKHTSLRGINPILYGPCVEVIKSGCGKDFWLGKEALEKPITLEQLRSLFKQPTMWLPAIKGDPITFVDFLKIKNAQAYQKIKELLEQMGWQHLIPTDTSMATRGNKEFKYEDFSDLPPLEDWPPPRPPVIPTDFSTTAGSFGHFRTHEEKKELTMAEVLKQAKEVKGEVQVALSSYSQPQRMKLVKDLQEYLKEFPTGQVKYVVNPERELCVRGITLSELQKLFRSAETGVSFAMSTGS